MHSDLHFVVVNRNSNHWNMPLLCVELFKVIAYLPLQAFSSGPFCYVKPLMKLRAQHIAATWMNGTLLPNGVRHGFRLVTSLSSGQTPLAPT